MRPGRFLPMLVVLALLALPASAIAGDFQQIFDDYKNDGQINGCYRADEIYNAGRDIPPDIEQYAPGFGDALASARCRPSPTSEPEDDDPELVSAGTPARGAGVKKKKAVREPPTPKIAPAVSSEIVPPQIAPSAAAVSSETPGALIALMIAAGIAVLLALGWTLAWFMGWSPERLTKPLSAAFQSVWERVLPGR